MQTDISNIAKYQEQFKLNYKQVLFCIYYDGNATSAAKHAGYKQPHVQGSRLLQKDNVQACIATLTARESSQSNVLSREELMVIWSDLARDTSAPWKDRLQATTLLGRAQAIFVDKTMIAAQLSIEHFEKYSDHELLAKVEEYMKVLAAAGVPLSLPEPEKIGS